MNSFIRLGFLPHAHNLSLLLLRVFIGTSLFLRHGLEKILGFSEMVKHFPDPLGLGAQWSLGFALISDAMCSLLLIIGLGTRWAALIVAVNTAVAFTFVHRLHLSGEHGGELDWLYLAGAMALFLSGAGKFSVDHGLASHGGEHHYREGRSTNRRKFRTAAR
jgi:putative oxidoreductase